MFLSWFYFLFLLAGLLHLITNFYSNWVLGCFSRGGFFFVSLFFQEAPEVSLHKTACSLPLFQAKAHNYPRCYKKRSWGETLVAVTVTQQIPSLIPDTEITSDSPKQRVQCFNCVIWNAELKAKYPGSSALLITKL